MTCEDLLALLGDYVNGDLARELHETFQDHLTDCPPCEVVVDNIRHTITVYRAGKQVELPPKLQGQLRHVLRARWKAMFPSVES